MGLHRAAGLLRVSVDLLRTFDPRSGGYRVFAAPTHHGGPATKNAQLAVGAAKMGEPWSRLICLSSVRVPLTVVALLRARGAKIAVNQNGVYYPLWCPDHFARRNRYLARLNALAHHSFFQSEFAEVSYAKWVGTLPETRSVLLNGVDRNVFHPDSARATNPGGLRVLVFLDFRTSTSDLWNYLLPLLREESRGATWVLLGREEDAALVGSLRGELAKAPVEWHISPETDRVAEVLRSCDVAIHLVYNDVCPNKVLECLASGVYVVCGSAGGSRELLEQGGGEALEVPEGYERQHYPTLDAIREALERFRARPAELRAEAARAAERFDLRLWLRAMTAF